MKKIFVVGIGPGGEEHLSFYAAECIKKSEVIISYSGYLPYIQEFIKGKEVFSTGMTGEAERCGYALNQAMSGKTAAVISTGDSGLYGMAGLVLELAKDTDIDVEIVPGISAAFAAASKLGAPLMHDTALISLSDRLTEYGVIMKRVSLAAEADFVIALYNPKSKNRVRHLREAIEKISLFRKPETPVGIVQNACRKNEKITITSLNKIDFESVDMFTILIVGNSSTYIKNGKIITPRGYPVSGGFL